MIIKNADFLWRNLSQLLYHRSIYITSHEAPGGRDYMLVKGKTVELFRRERPRIASWHILYSNRATGEILFIVGAPARGTVLWWQAGEDGLQELELAAARARCEADLIAKGVGQGPRSGRISQAALQVAGAIKHMSTIWILSLAHLVSDEGCCGSKEEERDKGQ